MRRRKTGEGRWCLAADRGLGECTRLIGDCSWILWHRVEAIKSKRERVVKKREYKLPDARYFSYWEARRQESNEFPHSWVGSILWITQTALHTHTNTHKHTQTHETHIAVLNYAASNLKPWPCTSPSTSINHFAWRIDPSTGTWHKYTWNRRQHDIFHHLLYPWIPTYILQRIVHTMDINILTQS